MLKIQEFARRGGVTVRAMRHYDSLGLLKPSARTKSGYRLYQESDLKRLEQIIALRAFGLSLSDIKQAVRHKSALPEALRRHQQALLEQRRVVTDAIDALSYAERVLSRDLEPDWKDLAQRVKRGGHASRLEQAHKQLMERRRNWTPQPEDVALMRDIKAAIERQETPATPSARVLVDRLKAAIDRFTGGDPDLRTAVEIVMADQVNWPGPPIGAKFREFFTEAIAA